jgi:histidine phosphotransfer protein HptB
MEITLPRLLDEERISRSRAHFGRNFARILGYLREDGLEAIDTIETAMRISKPAAMIGPADRIKAEAYDLGAVGLAEVAEMIELRARDCVERRQSPDDLLRPVVSLRRIFDETVALLDREVNPVTIRERPLLRERVARI